MNILVTGGSGILGRPLIENLLKDNHTITGLCRNPPTSSTPGLRWLQGDVSAAHLGLTDEEWKKLCTETSQIFHLAARTDFKGTSLADYEQINIDGVRHIKELALTSGAWLHHVSTAFVCGDWQGEFREDQLKEGQSFHNFYEASKYQGECVLREEPTPNFTVYRPAIILERNPTAASQSVFGPFVFLDGVFRICLGMIKHGEVVDTLHVEGDPQAHLPFVFDDETAETLSQLAAASPEHGMVYHLTPTTSFSNALLEKIFNQAFGRQAVTMATGSKPQDRALCTAEKILAKKTKLYRPYMSLTSTFARTNLDASHPSALPAIAEDSLLTAFSLFLATKKDLQRVINREEALQLNRYFEQFLQRHSGKPLIKNLSSLSACLHIRIAGYATWTITIDKGMLSRIEQGAHGQFGYSTDATTFLQVAAGSLSPQQGFFKGGIQLIGNPKEALRTATALEEFFHEYPYTGSAAHDTTPAVGE